MTEERKRALAAKALELHARKYNCAQSVACACADLVNADEEQLFRAMEAFGAGMGGFQETCGAVSGGMAVIGLANSNGSQAANSKASSYRAARALLEAFSQKAGSTNCGVIKGVESGVVLHSCSACIEDAVALTIEALEAEGVEL